MQTFKIIFKIFVFCFLTLLTQIGGIVYLISFCYIDNRTGKQTNKCPSFFGYGICEEPLIGEKNTADFCSENGYWRYNLLKKFIPQGNKKIIL